MITAHTYKDVAFFLAATHLHASTIISPKVGKMGLFNTMPSLTVTISSHLKRSEMFGLRVIANIDITFADNEIKYLLF